MLGKVLKDCILETLRSFENNASEQIFQTEHDLSCYLYMLLFEKNKEMGLNLRIHTEVKASYYMRLKELKKALERSLSKEEKERLENKAQKIYQLRKDFINNPELQYCFAIVSDEIERNSIHRSYKALLNPGAFDLVISKANCELAVLELKFKKDTYLYFHGFYNDFLKLQSFKSTNNPIKCLIILNEMTEELNKGREGRINKENKMLEYVYNMFQLDYVFMRMINGKIGKKDIRVNF